MKAVAERAGPDIERRRRIQTTGGLVSVARGRGQTGKDEGGGRKWPRRYSEGTGPVALPHRDETQIDVFNNGSLFLCAARYEVDTLALLKRTTKEETQQSSN